MGRVAVALVHWPCVDRAGALYATSLTNLDLHDIARTSRTYDVTAFYIVHPIEAQQQLAQAIAGFWDLEKGGRNKNPDRSDALSIVRVVPSIEAAIAAEHEAASAPPWVISTSAHPHPNCIEWADAHARSDREASTLVLFGTGHGLAPAALALASDRLPPVRGGARYNHLSVRSAVAICLDRLFGEGGCNLSP